MTAPAPRPELDGFGQTAWPTAYASVQRAGIWEPQHVFGLEMLASLASRHIASVRQGTSQTADEREIHRHLRWYLFQWHVVDREEPPPPRPDGLDPDVAPLCGLATTRH